MYFVIAYDIWPHLTGRALDSFRLMRLQLWTWFVGMIVLTFPWHYVGILGMPRRMAFYDYKDPMIAPQAASVTMSVIGGAILVVSGALFLLVLARGQRAPRAEPGRLSLQPRRAPAAAPAGGAERLRALARFDGGADPRELWLSHRPSSGDPGYRGAGDHGGGPAMSRRDSWVAASVGITAAIAIAGAIVGFAWLPLAQPGGAVRQPLGGDLQRGRPRSSHTERRTGASQADYPTTRVEVVPQMLNGASAESIGSGATLALRCTMCHGARGLSQANTPNLAGQSPIAIYKQLRDFQTGARSSAVMAPLVAGLSDADLRDLAAYYAYLPRVSDRTAAAVERPQIVASGAPMRGIAPCGACHGDPRQQGGRGVARGAARGLSACPARGFRRRHPAQRHRRADAQYRPRIDAGRNRCGQPVLRGSALAARSGYCGAGAPGCSISA